MASTLVSRLIQLVPIVAAVVIGALGLILLAWIFLKLYNAVRWFKQDVVYLELTPPSATDRIPAATEQLFNALHGLGMAKHRLYYLLRRETSFALEIVSTRQQGIRFILRVPEDKAQAVEQQIIAYVPDVKLRRVQGYFQGDPSKNSRILRLKQAKHFAFPLKSHESLSQHDPIGYLTNAMTKLGDKELLAVQLVITPTNVAQADSLSARILTNEDVLAQLENKGSHILPRVFNGLNSVLFGAVDVISNTYHGSSKSDHFAAQKELEYQKQVAKRIKPVRTLSYFEHELVDSIHTKLAQPLFKTEVRILLDCQSKQEIKKRRQSLVSAFNLYAVPKYQRLRTLRTGFWWRRRFRRLAFVYRLPAAFKASNIMSSGELAGLYHFPHSVAGKTENVVKSLSKTLPAPISLKNGTKLDILLGENHHHGSITPIGLSKAERERHAYIIGGTGNGKTTMLLYGIVQDIKAGKGVAVLDPHGDLSETILHHIPEERIRDVVYFNPDDISFPIGVNLLELPEGLDGDALLREKDLITESTISVMRKIFSEDDSGGHRIEYVLRNTIQTALKLDNPTLFTIFQLLNDKDFRKDAIKQLDDKDLINFWKNELGKAGDFQRVKMSAGITSKIGRFLFSASAKRILEQPKSTIDFDDILSSGKILICNFSKGLLGEDTSTLFGTTVLAKLQTAALRRARLSQAERRPFYLYVDEFQNFATMSFVQMLSEARKYQLFLTMAEQSTSQQDQQRLVDIILANVGTVICFRSGSPADERFVLPLFKPYIEEGEIANLPSFQFYMRIAALNAQEPLSGITMLLDTEGSQDVAERVKGSSRSHYATEYVEKKQDDKPETKVDKKKSKQTTPSLGRAIKSSVNP